MRFVTDKSVRNYSLLPGCTQVCVSHGLFMKLEHRGQGHGRDEQKKSLNRIKDLGFNYALCTVSDTNIKQHQILEDCGWKCLDTFDSSRGSTLRLYGRNMNEAIP